MKILSNKKYNELILKSCKGMFGAVTDDMLLREKALLNEENKQLKEEYKKVRDELLQYEIQNSKLQKELVELRVNTGRSVILGDKENE